MGESLRPTVFYGLINNPTAFENVTDVKFEAGNKTIIDPIGITDIDESFGFSGGNVAVTITGFFRGNDRRFKFESILAWRNWQAFLSHLPGKAPFLGVGLGQLSLYIFLSLFGWLFTEMTVQSHMAIKTITVNDSPSISDAYSYTIVFEKLSFGLLQYLADITISIASGSFTMRDTGIEDDPGIRNNNLLNSIQPLSDGVTTVINELGSIVNPKISLSTTGDTSGEYVSSTKIFSKIRELTANGVFERPDDTLDIGSVVSLDSEKSDDYPTELVNTEDFDISEFPARSSLYQISYDVDSELEWRDLVFMNTFPQSFSFFLDDVVYETSWGVYDIVDEFDESVSYFLRLSLKKDGVLVYAGKIQEKVQYVFENSIAIYISNFKIRTTGDGFIIHNVKGMVASA